MKKNDAPSLKIIPTPIGNLEDITLRSIRYLKEADCILCEDTRTSSHLLKHYSIGVRTEAFHQHNEHQKTAEIISRISGGEKIVLISDAGTPGISDPAFLLIRECLKNEIDVECLPGAVAFIPALVQSGFPLSEFLFVGFLPHKKGRQTKMKELREEKRTLVFYESPNRLEKLLEEIKEFFGAERNVSISRELTKMFEETKRGTAEELLNYFSSKPAKGEIVVCVAGK